MSIGSTHHLIRFNMLALTLVALLWLALARTLPSEAGGVVTICDDSHFTQALGGGGNVSFSCGGPKTITITLGVKTITQTTSIDGGGQITLTGNLGTRLFNVSSGVTLTLRNIILDRFLTNFSDGGAISSSGTLVLESTTIQYSRTDFNHSGAAIFSLGPVFISNSTFLSNTGGSAGAIFINFGNARAQIVNSTFSGNRALNTTTGYGGALWVGTGASVDLVNTTFINNAAQFGGALYATAGSTLTLTSATFLSNTAAAGGGFYNDGTATLNGATLSRNAAQFGGGIDDFLGRLTLDGSTLSGNSATQDGGGVFSNGPLTLTNSTLISNSGNLGGGLFVSGTATVNNSSFVSNTTRSGSGGGIYIRGSATLNNSTLSGNVAGMFAGGIFNFGTATVNNSTLSGNQANSDGGGLYSTGRLTLTNSTLSANSANADGGGIKNLGTLMLTNATLSGDSAVFGGGLFNNGVATLANATLSGNTADEGGALENAGRLNIQNSIVANSVFTNNCVNDAGSIVSFGYNLSSDLSCAAYFTQTTDLPPSTDPHLGLLADNGGPTKTHMPLSADSPGIDRIPKFTNGCGTTLISDQRGVPRPLDGNGDGIAACDIGAVEFQKLDQSISFGALPDRTLAQSPFSVSATATSGLPVTFSAAPISVCSVSGSTVTLVGLGTCTITAHQSGNALYNAAPDVSQAFKVVAKLFLPLVVR